jgi:hypothetical protein
MERERAVVEKQQQSLSEFLLRILNGITLCCLSSLLASGFPLKIGIHRSSGMAM